MENRQKLKTHLRSVLRKLPSLQEEGGLDKHHQQRYNGDNQMKTPFLARLFEGHVDDKVLERLHAIDAHLQDIYKKDATPEQAMALELVADKPTQNPLADFIMFYMLLQFREGVFKDKEKKE